MYPAVHVSELGVIARHCGKRSVRHSGVEGGVVLEEAVNFAHRQRKGTIGEGTKLVRDVSENYRGGWAHMLRERR